MFAIVCLFLAIVSGVGALDVIENGGHTYLFCVFVFCAGIFGLLFLGQIQS